MATDPVRDEAERLVAAAIAALSVASRTLPGWGARSGFATGSEECCVCPVCRAIAAMREPNSEFAERLATGAADLATGVAGLLRSLSTPTGWPRPAGGEAPAEGPDPWHEATSEPPAEEPPADESPAKEPPAKKPMAKKAVKKATKAKDSGPASPGLRSERGTSESTREGEVKKAQRPARAERAPRGKVKKTGGGEAG